MSLINYNQFLRLRTREQIIESEFTITYFIVNGTRVSPINTPIDSKYWSGTWAVIVSTVPPA